MKIKRPFWQGEDTPISCRQLGPVLQSYLDGEIDPADIEIIKGHLEACRDCGLEAETYTAIKQSLNLRQTTVPDAVLARLHEFSESLASRIDTDD